MYFGCLIEELLFLSQNDKSDHQIREQMETLRDDCLNAKNEDRPLFKTIYQQVSTHHILKKRISNMHLSKFLNCHIIHHLNNIKGFKNDTEKTIYNEIRSSCLSRRTTFSIGKYE